VTWNSGLNFFMLRKIIWREMTSGPPTKADAAKAITRCALETAAAVEMAAATGEE
jgi:hypothetical protein